MKKGGGWNAHRFNSTPSQTINASLSSTTTESSGSLRSHQVRSSQVINLNSGRELGVRMALRGLTTWTRITRDRHGGRGAVGVGRSLSVWLGFGHSHHHSCIRLLSRYQGKLVKNKGIRYSVSQEGVCLCVLRAKHIGKTHVWRDGS